MARFRKPVLAAGRYITRSGAPLDATPDYLRGLADKLRQLRAAGIRVPVSWGHQPAAEPADDASQSEFWRSALCCGTLLDLEYDPKDRTLWATGDAPAADIDAAGNLVSWIRLPGGKEIKSAVSEVSLGINDWRDGAGREWEQVPLHLALTTLPVAHGLGGFTPTPIALSTKQHHGRPALYLSLGGIYLAGDTRPLSRGRAMMTEEQPKTGATNGDEIQKEDMDALKMRVFLKLRDAGVKLGDRIPESFADFLQGLDEALSERAPEEDDGMTEEQRPYLMSTHPGGRSMIHSAVNARADRAAMAILARQRAASVSIR